MKRHWVVLAALILPCLAAAGVRGATLEYALDVTVDTTAGRLVGRARLEAPVDTRLTLAVAGLEKVLVDGQPAEAVDPSGLPLTLGAGRPVVVTYEAQVAESAGNRVTPADVFLNDRWYPRPDALSAYTLRVTLPAAFAAVAEAETVAVEISGPDATYEFRFEHPLDALHLAASTRYRVRSERFGAILLETYFFEEDAELAETYLDYARKFLALYEEMLTPYPYRRFAIVENVFPTGYSMPTFTLLGQAVVRLPFIVKTSLGHEILHEWFGNSVYIDADHGNWAEGLTSYLADHLYAGWEQQDRAYRKQILIDYEAYVQEGRETPLSAFRWRSDKAQAAIGYGKSAMVFHGLRQRFGDDRFFAALRSFVEQNRFRRASWHDLQRAFEKATGSTLYSNFGHWLERTDLPTFSIESPRLEVESGQLKLKLHLKQPGVPYPLQVPLAIYTAGGRSEALVTSNSSAVSFEMPLADPPLKVVVDENYDMLRRLSAEEVPPVLAGIMGAAKLTVAVDQLRRERYAPLIESLGVAAVEYVDPQTIPFAEVKAGTLVIAGYDNPLAAMLLGKQAAPADGVRLEVSKNPYNPAQRVVLVHVRERAEAEAAAGKLPHYGKYSRLAFSQGRNTEKSIASSADGLTILERPATRVSLPGEALTIDQIVPALKEKRVIFVGERHDRFAHHINQLQIIKKLHESGVPLGVGMEMFQVPYQQAVDDYLAGRIDEPAFLRDSAYFTKWRFEYDLYKPIVDYLKANNIPLVALNIEGQISRSVGRTGIESLSEEEKRQLPEALDLSDEAYRRDLLQVFSLHGTQTDLKAFDNFLQAQVLWDEKMAETAARFLNEHPERTLVVLAGNGHVRWKYGIPERLHRRTGATYAVVVQDDEMLDGIADYVLTTTPLEGREAPRLGVEVEEQEQGVVVRGVVEGGPAQRAGLQPGDVLVRFAGRELADLTALKIALFYGALGSTYEVEILRDGQATKLPVTLFPLERRSPHAGRPSGP